MSDVLGTEQPAPVKNHRPCVQDLVIQDIETRKTVGLKKYGTLLQPFNGRDALRDAYEEALDLCQYLRQALEERDQAVCRLPPPGWQCSRSGDHPGPCAARPCWWNFRCWWRLRYCWRLWRD